MHCVRVPKVAETLIPPRFISPPLIIYYNKVSYLLIVMQPGRNVN